MSDLLELFNLEGFTLKRQDFQQFQNTHLKCALKPDFGLYFWGHHVGNPGRIRVYEPEFHQMVAHSPHDIGLVPKDCPHDFTQVIFPWLSFLNRCQLELPDETKARWRFQAEAWEKLSYCQLKALVPVCGPHWKIPSFRPPWEETSISNLKAAREALDSIVVKSGNFRRPTRSTQASPEIISHHLVGGMFVMVTSNLCLLSFRGKACFGNRDFLLHLSDLVSGRYLVLISAHLGALWKEPHYLSLTQCLKLFEWGDNLLIDLGLPGYDGIKSFEAVMISKLMQLQGDPVTDAADFYAALRHELVEKDPRFGDHLQLLCDFADVHLKNPHHLSQAFGLYRIWGHPVVNVGEGLRKLKRLATTLKVIPKWLINELTCTFKEHFCVNYFHKHGKWPNLECASLSDDNYLKHAILEGKLINRSNPAYQLLDWLEVKGIKTFACDATYSLAQMIADSALSLTRSGIKESVRKRKTIGEAYKRRVLTNWLKSDFSSAKDLLEEIDQHGFRLDDLVIGVTPKEREEKIVPRMFALLTLKLRMYIVSLGQLSADYLVPYFPEITMMDDALSLTRRLYRMTSPGLKSADVKELEVTMNIDFEKWNSNMRAELTEGCFQFIDQLFGFTNCFSRVPEMFRTSYIYLADNSYLPVVNRDLSMETGVECWTGHLGGLEGLNQKPWTACTVILINIIARRHGFRYKLVGQGDNQVLRLKIPIPPNTVLDDDFWISVNQSIVAFKTDFANFMQSAGLPVKASETWISCDVFAYGKSLFYKGAPLAMSMKKLSRVFPLSNELFPSLENSISTIYSNAVAATQSDITPIIPFLVASSEVIYSIMMFEEDSPILSGGLAWHYLKSKGEWSVNIEGSFSHTPVTVTKRSSNIPRPNFPLTIRTGKLSSSLESMVVACLIPKIMGGYPIQYLSTFFCRGFPDQLTESLMMLRLICLQEQGSLVSRALSGVSSLEFSDFENAEMLVQDPYSVNYLMPSSPVGSLKTAVKRFLADPQVVQNPYFRSFFSIAMQESPELCKTLLLTRPVWPRLLHDIFSSSTYGYANSVVGKIIKATTLISRATSDPELHVKDKLRNSEVRYYNSVVYRINQIGTLWECDSAEADRLRNQSWKTFAPICGVTTPHPFSYIEACCLTSGGCVMCKQQNPSYPFSSWDTWLDYLLLKPSTIIKSTEKQFLYQLGPCQPYIGSKTEDKSLSMNLAAFQSVDPLLKRAGQVLRLVDWVTDRNDPFGVFLQRMFQSMTDIPPDLFFSAPGSISGSAEHRYKDYVSFHGGLLSTLYTIPSYVHLSTNMIKSYTRGGKNVKIHFQALMLSCQTSYYLSTDCAQTQYVHAMHYHLKCPRCIQEVDENKVTGDPGMNLYQFPDYTANRFCYISAKDVILEEKCTFKVQNQVSFNSLSLPKKYQVRAVMVAYECLRVLKKELGTLETTEYGDSRNLPIGWAKDISAPRFLTTTALLLYAYAFFACVRQGSITLMSRGLTYKTQCLNFLRNIPSDLFLQCGMSFQFPHRRLELLLSNHTILGPSSFPLVGRELAKCAKRSIIDFISENCFPDLNGIILLNNSAVDPFNLVQMQIIAYGLTIVQSPNDLYCLIAIAKMSAKDVAIGEDLSQVINALMLTSLNESFSEEDLRYQYVGDSWAKLRSRLQWVEQYTTTDKLVKDLGLEEVGSTHISAERQQIRLNSLRLLPFSTYQIERLSNDRPFLIYPDGLDVCCESEGNLIVSANIRDQYLPLLVKDRAAQIHAHRPIIIHTTAHYKYLQVLWDLYDIIPDKEGIAIVCGDGTGGVSHLVSLIFPVMKILFNSLILLDGVVPHSVPTFTPPCLDLVPGGSERIVDLQTSIEGVSDITDEEFPTQISTICGNNPVALIVCDAEGGGWETPEKGMKLAQSLIKICNQVTGRPVLIMKSYASNLRLLTYQCGIFKRLFRHVSLVRSSFSTPTNTECMIIGFDKDYLVDLDPLVSTFQNRITEDGLALVTACWSRIHSQGLSLGENQFDQISDILLTHLNKATTGKCLRSNCVVFRPSAYRDTRSEVIQSMVWGIYPAIFTSRLSDLARRFNDPGKLKTGYGLTRSILIHLGLMLSTEVNFQSVINTLLPLILEQSTCMYYVTQRHQTNFMIIPTECQEEVKAIKTRGLYYVRFRDAFGESHIKTLFRCMGQFRLLYGWKGTSDCIGVNYCMKCPSTKRDKPIEMRNGAIVLYLIQAVLPVSKSLLGWMGTRDTLRWW